MTPMDTIPPPDAGPPDGNGSPLSPAVLAAGHAVTRALSDPAPCAFALRSAAVALLAALDADAPTGGSDPFHSAGFDRTVLARLFAMTGPEVAGDLVLRLTEDLQSARAALAPAGASPPTHVLRAQAHVLVGLGGSVGATRLHDAARHLGDACRAGAGPRDIDLAHAALLTAVDAALAFLVAEGPSLPSRLAADA